MGSIDRRVAEIVRREQRHLRSPQGLALMGTTAVSSAAGRASKETQAMVEDGRSLEGAARMLGVAVRSSFPDAHHRPGYHARVPAEDRKIFGYGDLPDELIIDVNQILSGIMPDHEPHHPAKVLAARTMHFVMAKPRVTAHDLRERLAEQNAQDALFTTERPQLPATIMALDSVVTITHFMTTQYIEQMADQDRANPTQATA